MTEITQQPQNIDDLKISDKWKRRFKLFEKLNASQQSRDAFVKTDTFKQFTWRERYSVTSNLWAFLGGFIYYFIKGMHYKGAMILSLSMLWGMALGLIDFFSGITIPNTTYWIAPGVVCSMLASLDFYRKTLCGEKMWRSWPSYFHDKKSVITVTVASVVLNIASTAFIIDHQYSTEAAQNSDDAVRLVCGINNVYALQEEIDIFGEQMLCSQLSE